MLSLMKIFSRNNNEESEEESDNMSEESEKEKSTHSFRTDISAKNVINTTNCDIQNMKVNIYEYETRNKSDPVLFCISEPINSFVGRDENVAKITEAFEEYNKVVLCASAGIGKSELARYYIHKIRNNNNENLQSTSTTEKNKYIKNFVWINAEDRDKIKDSFEELEIELFPSRNINKKRNFIQRIHEIYNFFSDKSVLFIFDNVPHEKTIIDCLPESKFTNIKILLTSQFFDWNKTIKKIELLALDETSSVSLIKNTLEDNYVWIENDNDLKRLAAVFHFIPLGLKIVAACLKMRLNFLKENFVMEKFIQEMQEKDDILTKTFESEARYADSIYNALKRTIRLIGDDENKNNISQSALKLLYVCAHLPPENICYEDVLKLIDNDEDKLIESCNLLEQFNLISRRNENKFSKNSNSIFLQIHQLTQRLLKYHQTTNETYLNFFETAFKLVIQEDIIRLNTRHILADAKHLNEIFEASDDLHVKQLIENYKLLHNAVCSNLVETANLLLNFGANPNSTMQSLHDATPLCIAMANNLFIHNEETNLSEQCINLLISKEARLINLDKSGWSSLHWASFRRNLGLIRFFIENHKIDPNIEDIIGNTALHILFYEHVQMEDDEKWCKKCVEYLLKNKADPNQKNQNGWTILHWVAYQRSATILKYLIEDHKMDPHISNNDGKTPLFAIFEQEIKNQEEVNRCIDCIEYLKVHGISLDVVDNNGWSLLHYAAEQESFELIVYLIEKCQLNPNIKNNVGYTLLQIIYNKNKNNQEFTDWCIKCTKYLLSYINPNITDNHKWTLLHFAAYQRNLKLIKYLVAEYSLNIHCKDLDEDAVIHILLNKKITTKEDEQDCINCINYLNEKGVQIDTLNKKGWTLLHWAADQRNLCIIDYLFSILNPHIEDKNGRTCFLILFDKNIETEEDENKCIECIKFFKEKNYNLNITDKNNNTVLHRAIFHRNLKLIKFLYEDCDVAVTMEDTFTKTLLFMVLEKDISINDIQRCKDCITYFTTKNFDINSSDKYGVNLLHKSAFHRNLELIEFFIKTHEMYSNSKDIDGKTPLHYIFEKDIKTEEDEKQCIECVNLLLKFNAEINIKDKNGSTLLHKVAFHRSVNLIDYFIKNHKMDPNLKDSNGKTALHIISSKNLTTSEDIDKCRQCTNYLEKYDKNVSFVYSIINYFKN